MEHIDIKALALALGATNAGWLPTSKIPFDPVLRKACEANTCGSYGKTYACPPHVGEVDALIARAKAYDGFLLYQTVGLLEDSFDVEGMAEAGKRHKTLTRALHDALYGKLPGLLMLSGGGCTLCAACGATSGEPCRFPDKVIPSISCYCIEVSKAAAYAGLKYHSGANTVTFFGGVFAPEGYREKRSD